MRRQVIFDTDPSPDDAVGFLAAIASPEEFEVLAITTVAGNVGVELTSKNARKALQLARRSDIPVYAGAAAPLARPLVTAEHVHGRTGFDGYELPEPETLLHSGFAPDAIVELVMSRPVNRVTLCCHGAFDQRSAGDGQRTTVSKASRRYRADGRSHV